MALLKGHVRGSKTRQERIKTIASDKAAANRAAMTAKKKGTSAPASTTSPTKSAPKAKTTSAPKPKARPAPKSKSSTGGPARYKSSKSSTGGPARYKASKPKAASKPKMSATSADTMKAPTKSRRERAKEAMKNKTSYGSRSK